MHVRPIQQCPNCLKTKLNPVQYSEQSSRSASSLIKTNRKCKCMDHESEGQMYLSKIKHFDDMALSRVKKTAIAYAVRGKIVTSVRLDTAGINNKFLYTALSPEPPSMQPSNRKHYSSTTLGF